jgi:hypothetical protein
MKIFLLCIILALPSIKVHAAENPVPSLAVLDSIILVPVLATTPVLLADHAPPAPSHKIYIDTGLKSDHIDRVHHYRENNSGFGGEYQLDSVNSIHVGRYMNSLNMQTSYLGYAWQPIQRGDFKMGYMTAAVTGYSKSGGVIIAPLPMASWEYKMVGVNFIAIPTIVYAVQLKFRLD